MTNKHLNPEDFEGYGQEMSGLVNFTNQQGQEIERLKGQVENVGQIARESAEDIFYKELDRAVPDWHAINKDDKWLEWLGQVDPLTGRNLDQFLNEAQEAFDVDRVANFFKAFKGGGATFDQGSSESRSEKKGSTITRAQYQEAVKDAQTGRITEEEFNKIADQYQRQTTNAT